MAQFVLVANDVSNSDLEKALVIQTQAAPKVVFVPQQVDAFGVRSPGMASIGNTQLLNGVRFQWADDGAEFGAQIMKALAHPPAPKPAA